MEADTPFVSPFACVIDVIALLVTKIWQWDKSIWTERKSGDQGARITNRLKIT